MANSGKSLLSFIAGCIAGTTIGLLFAPDTGGNTRDKLKFTLGKYKDKIKELLEELTKEQEKMKNSAKEFGGKVVDETKEKAEQILNDVDNLITKIKEDEEK